jgi:hypothetical protein
MGLSDLPLASGIDHQKTFEKFAGFFAAMETTL